MLEGVGIAGLAAAATLGDGRLVAGGWLVVLGQDWGGLGRHKLYPFGGEGGKRVGRGLSIDTGAKKGRKNLV